MDSSKRQTVTASPAEPGELPIVLDPATGIVQIQRDIQPPSAFSAWVNKGPSHFQWKDDTLIVSGNSQPQPSPDQKATFTLRLDNHLKPVDGDQP